MDSVSQFVLGAAIGEAIGGPRAGNKALWVGALAGTIPDLDVIPGQWMDTVTKLQFHRGPSHSIAFALVMAPIMGWLTHKFFKLIKIDPGLDGRGYSWLYLWGFITHILLDCCTTWGTQLFWPFSTYPVAWQNIFVVDPLYTLPLLFAFIILHFVRRESKTRRRIIDTALIISHLYLALTFFNAIAMHSIARHELTENQIAYNHLAVRPAPFQNLLWGAVARTPDGNFLVSYISLMDRSSGSEQGPASVPPGYSDWIQLERGPDLPDFVIQDDRVQRLLGVMNGLYTIQKTGQGYRLNDLRFGRMFDWYVQHCPDEQTPQAIKMANRFVFAYDIIIQGQAIQRIDQIRAGDDQYDVAGKTMNIFLSRVIGNRNFCQLQQNI